MAVQTINSWSLPQFTDLVKRNFAYQIDWMENVMMTSGLVINDPMEQNTGEFKRYAERLHRNQYGSRRDEWDTAQQATIQYGYEKDLQVHTVALAVSITKRMRVAGKNQDMIDAVTDLATVCPNSIDLDLAHRITFATATSYTDRDGNTITTTVWDGLALASASHTLTGSADTYNNIVTGNPQFSKGALENAQKLAVEETYNNIGEKMAMNFDIIYSTDDPNTCNQIKELLNATADVSTDNAGTFNVYSNAMRHVKIPRIATTAGGWVDTTKAKYWGIASSMNSSFYFSSLESPYLKTPTDGNNGEEFSSENWNYLAGTTYGIAIVDARWIKFSAGDWS